MTFPKTSQVNPVDMSAHRSDLGITFLLRIFVFVTQVSAALGSHLILVALVFYSQSDDFSQDESNKPS